MHKPTKRTECKEEAHIASVSGVVGKGRPSGATLSPYAAGDAAFKADALWKEGESLAPGSLPFPTAPEMLAI